MVKKYSFDKPYIVSTGSREKWIKKEAYPTKGVLKFYTDGSRLDFRAGYGIPRPGVDMAVPQGRHATVFQVEVMAIDSCSRRLIQMRTKGLKYLMLSDSQAALKALDTCSFDSKAV
ncbi:hypothetical protein J6590_108751 [Homalodisca vitripennis]|nr:hypothetical protein J6590_108751 [Homalodisca vitripennis]